MESTRFPRQIRIQKKKKRSNHRAEEWINMRRKRNIEKRGRGIQLRERFDFFLT